MSSDSTETSSSKSSESDQEPARTAKSERQRESEECKEKVREAAVRALSGPKFPLPPKWDGIADVDEFDSWVFDVKSWQGMNGLTDEHALRMVLLRLEQ